MPSTPPKAFISYSWDDETHRAWVKELAARLRHDGVDVTLDQWHAVPGDQLPAFMEQAVRDNDFVLLICTPAYQGKFDNRRKGVGYEGDIVTGEVYLKGNQRKFIPILRRGEWTEVAPSALAGKYYIDLHGDSYSETAYQDLLSTLLGTRSPAPPIGTTTSNNSAMPKTSIQDPQRRQALPEVPEIDPAPPKPSRPAPKVPQPRPGETWVNSIGMEFVWIPAGTFTMGSSDLDQDAFAWEKPAHQVTISKPFYMGKYPVTQVQWEAVMSENPSRFKGDPNRPVEQVSWDDAQAFIRKINEREKAFPCRLPTEAEWEYACRAGTTTMYSFGDDARQLGDHAWYGGNAGRETHPVGQRKPNAWGLYDMHGNVWEWVQDWYGEYPSGAVTDPTGPLGGPFRVVRGGSWSISARLVRAAVRRGDRPGGRNVSLGFRCCRVPDRSG